MLTVALSDQEMQAYYESPRTFFGREERETQIDDPLKLYDRIYDTYQRSSKETLLALFAKSGAENLDSLCALPQERLAEIYAERTTEAIANETGLAKPVAKPPDEG